MKRMIKTGMAIGTLILLVASGLAQSLGDAAREARNNKPQSDTSRHYDNDNLPANQTLSVVGPEAPQPAKPGSQAGKAAAADPKAAEAERQKAAEEMQKEIDAQKEKIGALNHELDLDQREYRLRAAAFYGDAGNQLRDPAKWSKEDAQYKADIDAKQKAIAAAQQELADLQEKVRKEGIREKDSDSDKEKEKDK